MTSSELENRLIDFAVACIKLAEKAKKSFAADHLNGQLIRSSSSAALNYSEAIGASSTKDYIFKMQICLKELRESKSNLTIQSRASIYDDSVDVQSHINEATELVKIFSKSISTTKNKMNK
jgi:four helix bundle protein